MGWVGVLIANKIKNRVGIVVALFSTIPESVMTNNFNNLALCIPTNVQQ